MTDQTDQTTAEPVDNPHENPADKFRKAQEIETEQAGQRDTAEAVATGYGGDGADPDPVEVTDPDDPSYVLPAGAATATFVDPT